jgi:putative addiction module killer protein
MEAVPKRLVNYRTPSGREPFSEWIDSLKDVSIKARMGRRLNRVARGNLGKHRPVGQGVLELKEDFGPGYRLYLGLDGAVLVILLCGGDKGSQAKDILRAQAYWGDHKFRKGRGTYGRPGGL